MLSLFLVPEISGSSHLTVVGDEAHHAVAVTRLGVGDGVLISDGAGNWASGTITSTEKKSFTLSISERGSAPASAPQLTLVQALPKSDRIKEALELLVEAGADRIIPWAASRSISKWQEDSLPKWQNTVQAATKQSRRYFIPQVDSVCSTKDLLARFSGSRTLVLHESGTQRISQVVDHSWSQSEEIFLLIGPEGGITPEELEDFQNAGALIVSMGEPVFRSAHAGVAALSAVQALIGRW
jgi:16S rRNA (uracil1498-N3)-methyltransferase